MWKLPFGRAYAEPSRWWPFLLHELPPEEHARVEARLLAEPDTFEEVVGAENDLLDAFSAGRLSSGDRRRVERYVQMSPAAGRRAAFAQSLHARRGADAPAPAAAVWTWTPGLSAYAAAAVLAIAVGVAAWSAWQADGARRELAAERSSHDDERSRLEASLDRERQRAEQLAGELRQAPPPAAGQPAVAATPASRGVLAFALVPGVRGNDLPPRMVIPPRTGTIQLELDAETLPRTGGAQASLRDAARRTVWTGTVRFGPDIVVLDVPALDLAAGEYELTIEGGGGLLASFAFAIARP